ncbi:ImmA/IrrE family metallo-endopeptidase [bacterium]|nr:ImmA/IrrE family metallo-endopeptidase [bacterium]
MGLGVSPAWEIAETIRSQGVRVTELDMPENISGIFFHGPDIGLVIVNNRKHHRNRRLFSYAHEYCHLLVDRGRPGNVSRYENQNELIEIRANSFAAHFLMPEPGVRSFLRKLGKGEPTRQVQELFSWNQSVEAQKRAAPGSQDLQVHDVVCLAHYFGVSYDAALYHLLNLKLITKERHEELRQQSAVAKKIASILQLPNWDESVHWNLSQEILSLSFEAYRRGEISKQKVIELATEVKADKRKVAQILQVEDSENEAVDAVF